METFKVIVVWILYILTCNVILFVCVALPWYGVITVSNWYMLIAFPSTALGGLLCGEMLFLRDQVDDWWED